MQKNMARLLSRMESAGKANEVLPMHYVLKACTSDVITEYAFGGSFHFMEMEDYAIPYMKATDVFHLFNHAFCHFPFVGTIITSAPILAIRTFVPGLTDMWNKQGVRLRCFPLVDWEQSGLTIVSCRCGSNKLKESRSRQILTESRAPSSRAS